MSTAAAQYDKFKDQVVREGRVFTFKDKGGYLVYPVDGTEVMAFWSSRTRLERIQKEHPKYVPFDIVDMPLTTFLEWLPKMEKDRVRVGVNWSGKRLTGYDVEARALLEALRYLMEKLKT